MKSSIIHTYLFGCLRGFCLTKKHVILNPCSFKESVLRAVELSYSLDTSPVGKEDDSFRQGLAMLSPLLANSLGLPCVGHIGSDVTTSYLNYERQREKKMMKYSELS